MTTKYRMVTDQANIGIEPFGERTAVSNGTYHGRVYLVQSCGPGLGDGWSFVAAFLSKGEAVQFCGYLSSDEPISDKFATAGINA